MDDANTGDQDRHDGDVENELAIADTDGPPDREQHVGRSKESDTKERMVREAGDEGRSMHAWQSVADAGSVETGPSILRGRQEESNCA